MQFHQDSLNYIFNLQVSHKMFIEDFNGFHVEGWKKVSVGNFIYFLQDVPDLSGSNTDSEMTEKMIISSTSEVNDGSLNQFYSSGRDKYF